MNLKERLLTSRVGKALAGASTAALTFAITSKAFAQATTMEEVVADSIGAVTEGTTDALIANLPVVIVAVVGIAISFKLIKLGLRWVLSRVR